MSRGQVKGSTFTDKAISELINFMDKTIGLQVVMVAGYEDKMVRCFFPSNEGLDRRFPYKWALRNYNTQELTIILINNLIDNEMPVSSDISNLLYSIIDDISTNYPAIFKNQAGDMVNLNNFIMQSAMSSLNLEWADPMRRI